MRDRLNVERRTVGCALVATALLLGGSSSVVAQGPPDIQWMRGGHGNIIGGLAYSHDGTFFASAAASSAYLTVSEIFPLEMRAVAISIFYAIGTGIGGFIGPALYGTLIGTGSRDAVFFGYAVAGLLMTAAAVVAAWIGIDAERRPLETVARPLSAAVEETR